MASGKIKRRTKRLDESGWYDVDAVFLQLSLLSAAFSIRYLCCSVDSNSMLDEEDKTRPKHIQTHTYTAEGSARLNTV